MNLATIRRILANLTLADIAVFVLVFVLTLAVQILAVSAAGVAELAGRLLALGEAALADLAEGAEPAGEPVYVVTAMRTRDVPAWSMR